MEATQIATDVEFLISHCIIFLCVISITSAPLRFLYNLCASAVKLKPSLSFQKLVSKVVEKFILPEHLLSKQFAPVGQIEVVH